MVAKAGKTTCHSIRYCHGQFVNTNIRGYVLNGIDSGVRRYGCYYRGQYGYKPYAQQRTYYRAAPELKELSERQALPECAPSAPPVPA
ncbi:MAG TPA: hypothetical protein DCR55_09040 [Lentisphaeria bacterium]|jgi:hypothetical protein|nr:hypothetical protein [Lentisphaeria bacterium]